MQISGLLGEMKIGDWFNSLIAVATCAAAVFSYLAARAARRQAQAAWAQVGLQRPRPVITIEGNWSLEKLDDKEPSGFLLRNVGASPAFDVEISEIPGPVLRSVGYAERLVTDRIFSIAGESIHATHYRRVAGTDLTRQALPGFLLSAAQEGLPGADAEGNPVLDHQLKFSVKYSAMDGRRFQTTCLIRFNLGVNVLRAWIVPVSSWLGAASEAGAPE